MIYQCYHAPDNKQTLFNSPVYCGFGLEPDVNPNLANNCPELEDPAIRRALTEYSAMLHLWRNPSEDCDDWIGFTSYRQLMKTSFVFRSRFHVSRKLWRTSFAGWGFYKVGRYRFKGLSGAAAQAERAHPGIMALLERMADLFDFEISNRFYTDSRVLYCNYWVMKKAYFNQYMEWSWPKVKWCLEHQSEDPFLNQRVPGDEQMAARNGSEVSGKAVGYVMERLFILWYMGNGLKPGAVGPLLYI